MEDLIVKPELGNYDLPYLYFKYESGVCIMEGESYPENTIETYQPILDWLIEFMFERRRKITFDFKLHYFNTSSSKMLYEILVLLKKYQDEGGDVVVNWYAEDWDIDLIDDINDYTVYTDLKINTIIVPKVEFELQGKLLEQGFRF